MLMRHLVQLIGQASGDLRLHLLHRLTTLLITVAFAVLAFLPHFTASAADGTRPPNVVLILADDLGYGDLSFQGGTDIRTPHLDALAASGVRCTSGYVTCPVCSPTRAGLLTGRYQQRFGHEFNPGNARQASAGVGLPTSETTIANVLKDAGYATGIVGKWHLGYEPQFHPLERGFDEFFGFLGGANPYLDPSPQKNKRFYRNREPVEELTYATDAFTRESLAYIDRHAEHPFFLYLSFNAVHGPLQASDNYLARVSDIPDERRRTYAAMLTAMDDGVGAVVDRLRALKLEENTLIFFTSDNGGIPRANASRNDPLSGAKGTVYEGGIRVPYVISWKGRVPAGETFAHPVNTLDILATAAAAAGAKLPTERPIDGIDLLPYVTGKNSSPPHEHLFWRFGTEHAVRRGDYKYRSMPGEERKLFNLANDLHEQEDLSAEQPELLAELEKAYLAWDAELVEPLWPGAKRLQRPGSDGAAPPRKAAKKKGKRAKAAAATGG